jgi:uncharacterized protein YegJ (DUF2314 family)
MPPVRIGYALFLTKEIADVPTRFHHASHGNIELLTTEEEGHDKAGVILECQSTTERPIPSSQVLAHFGRGFDAKSAAALGQAKAAISLMGVGPFDAQHRLLRELTLCVSRLSRELNAVVFDTADWLTFTPNAFHALRAAEVENGQLSSAQFGVRAYRIEDGLRSVSMGLEKFCQPNFALTHFSEHQMGMMDRMMTLAMQHIIESDKPMTPGPLTLSIRGIQNEPLRQELTALKQADASGEVTLQLDTVAPRSGDPKLLLAPIFQSTPGPQLWEEQGKLLKQLFGVDRQVSQVDMGEQIQQAIEKAQARATTILSDPKKWRQEGHRFRIAVVLPKIREVVWLEVTEWKNGHGTGILLSQPQHVSDLNSGDTVSFTADAIKDYTLSNPERELESGGVDELVRKLRRG